MADLDHFKALNDAHGHETGDRGLRLFAQTLKTSLRGEDLLARYGGEEFAAVLPKCTTENAEVILERVRVSFTTALQAAGLPLVTASFGVVASHADETLASSLRRADVALFQAKHEGRDRIVVHDLDRPAAPLASVDPFEPFRDATLADAALTDAALNNGH
jgi:diguanylate cyclase (GGDEF)-like protein